MDLPGTVTRGPIKTPFGTQTLRFLVCDCTPERLAPRRDPSGQDPFTRGRGQESLRRSHGVWSSVGNGPVHPVSRDLGVSFVDLDRYRGRTSTPLSEALLFDEWCPSPPWTSSEWCVGDGVIEARKQEDSRGRPVRQLFFGEIPMTGRGHDSRGTMKTSRGRPPSRA